MRPALTSLSRIRSIAAKVVRKSKRVSSTNNFHNLSRRIRKIRGGK